MRSDNEIKGIIEKALKQDEWVYLVTCTSNAVVEGKIEFADISGHPKTMLKEIFQSNEWIASESPKGYRVMNAGGSNYVVEDGDEIDRDRITIYCDDARIGRIEIVKISKLLNMSKMLRKRTNEA